MDYIDLQQPPASIKTVRGEEKHEGTNVIGTKTTLKKIIKDGNFLKT